MKFTKLSLTFVSIMITVSMKWYVEPDGSLKIWNAEDDIEYVEITGSSIHWRDRREGRIL